MGKKQKVAKHMKRRTSILLLLVVAAIAVVIVEEERAPQRARGLMVQEVSLEKMTPASASDSAMEAVISTYRDSIDGIMREPLCVSDTSVRAFRPESPMTRLMADILLSESREFAEGRRLAVPNMALTNIGGIRDELPKGTVTVGDAFRIAPFENSPVVVKLDSAEVMEMLHHVARRGGEALSGVVMTIADGRATDVRVGGKPLRGGREYRVATLDYLATGGDGFNSLEGHEEYRMGVTFREVFMSHLRKLDRAGLHVMPASNVRIHTQASEQQ